MLSYAGRCLWCRREIGTGHSWPCPYARPRPPRLLRSRLGASLLALAGLLVLACPAWADLRITGTTTVSRDGLVKLKAEGLTEGAGLIWRASPRKGVSRATTDQALFEFAAPPGVYEVDLIAVRLKDGKTLVEEATATVVIGEAPPVPPPPGPAPPPGPVPPGPNADLVKLLAAAYATDQDAGKDNLRSKLASIFRGASTSTTADTGLKTVGDIDAVIRQTTQDAVGVLTLPATRDAVGKWLRGQLPTPASTPLDDTLRQKMRTAYSNLADALEAVK